MEPGCDRWVHYQVEAMKIAIRASFDHFADPRAMRIEPSTLLDPDSVRKAAGSIGENASPLPPLQLPISHDTVYLCAADETGNMVSMIQSNFQGFGSGIVIDGTGIAMQNRGAGFSLQDGHPNEVAGGKRPYHTIIPGFVTQDKKPKMAFGVMGGHMQHQGHVQMVTRIFDHNENPQAASDAPRWHVGPNFELLLEDGTSKATFSGLADRGHHPTISGDSNIFGGAQLIYALDNGYCAASDHRKEGMAAGY
jgi:gamma-glutamyltranspeptidase/glutathione hydrolase